MAAAGTALHMAPKPKKLSPKQIEENRVAEEARLAAEATAEDVALLESFRANVEEWLLDEAKGEDALAEVLAAAAAAKKERRQAAERKKIEEVMWAEAVQADEELEARAEELRLAELARIEAKRREMAVIFLIDRTFEAFLQKVVDAVVSVYDKYLEPDDLVGYYGAPSPPPLA